MENSKNKKKHWHDVHIQWYCSQSHWPFTGLGYEHTSHNRLFWAVRSVPQLSCPGHLNLPQKPEPGLIRGPPGYGGGRCWSWHTADRWSQWEPDKSVDQHYPETTSLNRLNRGWRRGGWRRVSVKKLQTQTVSIYVPMRAFVFVFLYINVSINKWVYLLCSDPRF